MTTNIGPDQRFTLIACFRSQFPDQIQHLHVSAYAATRADADALVARFPKSVKLRASDLGGDPEHKGYVHMYITLHSDGVNHGRNETGIRRYWAFRKAAERLGIPVEYKASFGNSYQTEADFHTALEN